MEGLIISNRSKIATKDSTSPMIEYEMTPSVPIAAPVIKFSWRIPVEVVAISKPEVINVASAIPKSIPAIILSIVEEFI